MFATANAVVDGLEATFGPDGFSVFHTTGPPVGSVEHAHVHVIPRYEDDVHVSLPRRHETDPGAVAERLRSNL